MKRTALLIVGLLAATLLTAEDEVESRLRNMECIVPIRTDASVINRIQTLLRGRKDTEKMIGRSASFFPIFEHYLKEYDLPSDLKYITCLETELNNKTISYAGAKGIWQLMPDVKEEFGLRIDKELDERLDLNRGTEAALKDLKRLYKIYGDWELVLAGYNCGAGRLGKAMKRARSKDFNRVKVFLPKQTQEYISKFIAFTYLMKNYRSHGLEPQLPSLDEQTLGSIKVYNCLSLAAIANVTSLPYTLVKSLNPQYREEYVPTSNEGCNIILPRRVISIVEDFIKNPDSNQLSAQDFVPVMTDESLSQLENDPDYFQTSYIIAEDENLETIAQIFNTDVYNIMLWNSLELAQVSKGQELILYLPRIIPKRAANITSL